MKMTEESQFNKLKTELIQKVYESNQQLIYVADIHNVINNAV